MSASTYYIVETNDAADSKIECRTSAPTIYALVACDDNGPTDVEWDFGTSEEREAFIDENGWDVVNQMVAYDVERDAVEYDASGERLGTTSVYARYWYAYAIRG